APSTACASLPPCRSAPARRRRPLRKQALTLADFPTKPTFNPEGSDGGLLQDVNAAGRAEPDDVGQADLGVGDLAVAGLAPEVVADLPDVGDAGGGDGVALGLQAARHVDRRRAVPPAGAGLEEVDRPTLLAEHAVVVVDELGGGEAVVQLDEVEVLRPDAGGLVGLGGGVAGQRVDVGEDLAGLLPG